MTIQRRRRPARGRGGRPLRGLPDHRGGRRARSSPRCGCRRWTATGSATRSSTAAQEDWAMVAVCALVKKAGDGSCEDVRDRAHPHGHDAAAGDRRRAGAARRSARRRLDRRGRRAGGRGDRAARRPQRLGRTTSATWRGCCAGGRCEQASCRCAVHDDGGRDAGPGRPGLPRRPRPAHRRSSSPPPSSSRCCSRARPGVGKTEVARGAGRRARARG